KCQEELDNIKIELEKCNSSDNKTPLENKEKHRLRLKFQESQCISKLIRLKRSEVIKFPTKDLLLPTAFGNTIRAFEIYPPQMYGLDAIEGWNRLLAVIPKDYRELIDATKAQTDFWLNLGLLSLLALLEYICISIYKHELKALWIPLGILTVNLIAYSRATAAAAEWGAFVKGAFDIFLPELYKKLSFAHPNDRGQERDILMSFSQAFLYRLPEMMPPRAQQKPENNQDTSSGEEGSNR
ncbi:MAG TPA: hypothetical protein V6C65_34975, partial [Allocoleopsis sp.]